jgi:hypothetical protein
VLAVSARTDTTTDVTATNYFSFSIGLDFVAPDAPMVSDAAGDRQIGLAWTNSTTETLTGANVYVDTSVDCMGTSTTLVEGMAVPATLEPTATVSGSSPTSRVLDGQTLGLAIGESALVAVTVLDTARNESVFSNVACIERVTVAGFWDAYCAEHGLTLEECRQRYSGCAALPGRRPLGWIWLVGIAALLLVVGRRVSARGAR